MVPPRHEIKRQFDHYRRAYARQWEATAQQHLAAGDYNWMAAFLDNYPKLIEIGTGTGIGTERLVARGHSIVSLDLNPFCLDMAQSHLRANGVTPNRQDRKIGFNSRFREDGVQVEFEYGDISKPITPQPPIVLMESDIFLDKKLPDRLSRYAPFDAVVLWCVGAFGF